MQGKKRRAAQAVLLKNVFSFLPLPPELFCVHGRDTANWFFPFHIAQFPSNHAGLPDILHEASQGIEKNVQHAGKSTAQTQKEEHANRVSPNIVRKENQGG